MPLDTLSPELRADLALRHDRLRAAMQDQQVDACLLSSPISLLYAAGRLLDGFLYLDASGFDCLFVRGAQAASGERVHSVPKPEAIPALLQQMGVDAPRRLALEADEITAAEYFRLARVFPDAQAVPTQGLCRQARMLKTPWEIALLRQTCARHSDVYAQIPALYRPGMTDTDFSIAAEQLMRRSGHLGIFRTHGIRLEAFMGTVLAGDNAAAPSPYDFALGGAGTDQSYPLGANGTPLTPGTTLMCDISGNFYGYNSDLTRTYSIGAATAEVRDAHALACRIHQQVAAMARPGVTCEALYAHALALARQYSVADRFMGMGKQARFIGHGVGLVINELPVLAPRFTTALQAGMVIALEPKLVLPGVGAVGVEDTYLVTDTGMERLTTTPWDLLEL